MFDDEPESIYNLIPKPPPVVVKQPLHVSKYAGSHQFETVKKRDHGTMGQTKDQLKKEYSPQNYLKKHSRAVDLPPKDRSAPKPKGNISKPPVPRKDEIPKMQGTQKKNYIVENWKQAPKTKKLHPEKEQTWYTDKKDFGKRPKYLDRVIDEYQAENQFWDEVRESMAPEDTETRCRLLSEEERLNILEGLKANMADIKRRYAALSFGQDNLSFRQKKEGMEAEMAQLEKDITTFSRANVYVTES